MKLIVLVIAVSICLGEATLSGWQKYEAAIRHLSNDTLFSPLIDAHLAAFREAEKTSPYHPERAGKNFACSGGPSPTVPTSVHAVRPGDIKVIAALGDSLTAANGADAWTILGCLTEYRGTSWSIGGDRSVNNNGITLANILRTFNPNLFGWSSGTGDRDSSGARLNVAKAGDESRHMYEQAQLLVQRLQNDPNVNFQQDWKLITLFVGGNDLCRFCGNEADFTGELYGNRVEQAVQVLYDNVPRAIVQVVSIFDIGPLAEMGGLVCSTVHVFACDCVRSQENLDKVTVLTGEFQLELRRITSDAKFLNHDDFTVVLQPFFERTQPPRKSDGSLDTSFFAPDCFHFSRKGHHLSATTLWNQMFQPVGLKDTEWDLSAGIYCPGPNEYIATYQNSKR